MVHGNKGILGPREKKFKTKQHLKRTIFNQIHTATSTM